MKILIVTATKAEMNALTGIIDKITDTAKFKTGAREVKMLITGVGPAATAWQLTKWIHKSGHPDLVVNAGIAGSFKPDLEIGSVVHVGDDRFADYGVQLESGIITPEEAGLTGFDASGGVMYCKGSYAEASAKVFKLVSGITVGAVTGSAELAGQLRKKFNPDIETMEGASFFYICTGERVPFLALRSVSNFVGIRDKTRWNIPLALKSLGDGLEKLLLNLD